MVQPRHIFPADYSLTYLLDLEYFIQFTHVLTSSLLISLDTTTRKGIISSISNHSYMYIRIYIDSFLSNLTFWAHDVLFS